MYTRGAFLLVTTVLFALVGCAQNENRTAIGDLDAQEKTPHDSLSVEVRWLPGTRSVDSQIRLAFRGALKGATLSKKARHSLFAANSRYLVWKKTDSDTLCVYDLRADEVVRTFWMPRGRGPGEFRQLSGVAITDNDVVYFAEPNQAKFLRFDVREGPLEDLTFQESGFRPERVAARGHGRQLVAKRASSGSNAALIGIIGSDRVFRAAADINLRKDLGSLFFQAGDLDATQHRAFFLTRYRPWVYVFDLERNRFVKKAVYGTVDVDLPSPESTDRGVMVFRAPKNVQFFAHEVVAVSGHPNRVLVRAAGATDEHSFNQSAFYEVDVQTGTIVAEHDLGIKIRKVAAADGKIYIYDDEKRKIFAYRLESSER